MSKNLQMSLKTKWFEMTKSGEKTEDYREITPYWCKRLLLSFGKQRPTIFWKTYLMMWGDVDNENFSFKEFNINTMTKGYPSKDDKEKIIQFEHAGIEIRTGNPEWGAEEGKLYFVIKHGKRIYESTL